MSKIVVKLNPDTPPTGTDLSVVNAARRSFNTRSDWEYKTTSVTNYDVGSGEEIYTYVDKTKPTLKDKDKRLIEFLARGMTAADFSDFCGSINEATEGEDYQRVDIPFDFLVDKLWQWRNTPTHDTPFNHCFISFEVKAPIFVARQLVKHEYLIMSEFSRRYITDGIEFYEPDYWRKAAPNKKQGSLEEPAGVQGMWSANAGTLEHYQYLVSIGVAPEQARMVLPQSTMTEWTWSGTLGAFAKMCQLRLHPEAQYEARLVAQEVYKYLKEYFPVSAPALVEGVM